MKLTPRTGELAEAIIRLAGYKVRYEKGTFKSGYCLLQEQKVVVVNKFHPLETRINALLDILLYIHVDEAELTPDQQKLYATVRQTRVKLEPAV